MNHNFIIIKNYFGTLMPIKSAYMESKEREKIPF